MKHVNSIRLAGRVVEREAVGRTSSGRVLLTFRLMTELHEGKSDVHRIVASGDERVQEALDVIGERGVVWVQGRMVYRSFSGPGGRPGTSAEVLASRIWMERAAATDDNE